MTIAPEFDLTDPQKTLSNWMKLKDRLSSSDITIVGKSCNTSLQQSIALEFLYSIFPSPSSYSYSSGVHHNKGILEEIWPHASFYARQLAPLQNLTLSQSCLSADTSTQLPYLCYKGKCKWCVYATYVNEPIDIDGPLSPDYEEKTELCDQLDPQNLPQKGPGDPERAETIRSFLLAQNKTRNSKSPSSRVNLVKERATLGLISHPWNFLTWKDLRKLRQMLLKNPIEKFEKCQDNIPMSVAAQKLWQLFNLKDNDEIYLKSNLRKVKRSLESHPEYYRAQVGILMEAKSGDVTCKWGTFCGPDGLCTVCGLQGIPWEYEGVCKWETEDDLDSDIERWERKHV